MLIIDDDPDLLDMYEEVLQIEGLEIIRASSGTAAIDICKSNTDIKIIISDANMGEMSGIELLKNLGSYYETMPVLYLLTGDFEASETEVLNLGGRGVFLKPFDLDEILERIKKDINS